MSVRPTLQKAALVAFLPFVLQAQLQAQESEYSKQYCEPICHSPYRPVHFSIRHIEPRGVGYEEGYTTVEGYGIYDGVPSMMPFLDLRGHVFNHGKFAGNIGIGERAVLPSINHMLGMYFYYDVRQENHGLHTVNQLGPGIELIGKRMEYHLNGYFPIGKDKSHRYGRHKRYQKLALSGGDAEVGVHLTQSTKYDLFTAVGPYYFTSHHATSWGGKTRFVARYKQYISLEASYSFDNLFKSVIQGTVALNFPFGGKLKRCDDVNCPQKNDLMLSRAAFAPYRFEIPVVKRRTFKS